MMMMMMITLFPPKFEDYHTYIDNKHQNKLSKEQNMVHIYKKANNELKFVTKFSLESDRFPTMQMAVSMTVYECSSRYHPNNARKSLLLSRMRS